MNPRETHRHRNLLRRYRLTIFEFEQMLLDQGGRCLICKRLFEERARGTKRAGFTVDHCHATKKVRGLLCTQCNSGLGAFDENPDILLNAIRYIAEHCAVS